jgi:hypothetical protein
MQKVIDILEHKKTEALNGIFIDMKGNFTPVTPDLEDTAINITKEVGR